MVKIQDISNITEVTVPEYNVAKIEYIKKHHSVERSLSKPVTFALQYFGTEQTLVNNSGFSLPEATSIVANYKELYKQSEQYKQSRLEQAAKDGYANVAFGLKIRVPVMEKSIINTSKTPKQTVSESRSVGNAMFQSYGILTNRAVNALMESVWNSEYRQDILPICLIHDAIYLMVRDDIRVIEWVNNHLIKEMQWQELPEIQHDKVKLGAELSIFYPSWANEIVLNNNISQSEIKNAVKSAMSS